MKKISTFKLKSLISGLSMILAFCLLNLSSCGSSNSKASDEENATDDEAFYKSQPVESGLYDADYYDIIGKNSRKGKFDGRIYFGLTPKTSAINVFENGNRTKIDYLLVLQKPFEKNDSGVYVSVDMKNNPVCVVPDTVYALKFIHSSDTVQINFNPKPRHTASGLQILEKIRERKADK